MFTSQKHSSSRILKQNVFISLLNEAHNNQQQLLINVPRLKNSCSSRVADLTLSNPSIIKRKLREKHRPLFDAMKEGLPPSTAGRLIKLTVTPQNIP